MGGKPVTKPGQSQTVNIARTISAVSSAALFLPGILVRPAGQTIRGAALADCCPSVLLVRSDHRSTSFSKAPMDALKRSVERAGSNMDSIIHLDVFLCLPLAETIPTPTGKARFDAHKAQYDALNKIYGTYFSPGKAPSRACVAVEWIPGDSLIEIVGSALVVGPPTPSADK